MIAVPSGVRILLATRPVDFRKGMDGLAALVQQALQTDPFAGDVFIFRPRRADRVKILVYDGTGLVLEKRPDEHWTVVRVALPEGLDRYVVEKGSITVDGISLTVTAVTPDWFEVSLIPTTLALTTLGPKGPGDPVNLEVDVLAKHVEKLLLAGVRPAGAVPEGPA